MKKLRLTAAQAMVRYLSRQLNEDGQPFLAGCWAIFGHGNVAGIGEALHAAGDDFPTWRAHNEQAMAHAAIAYAKALNRKRAMAVTTSIGPGALNMVTAAALAHVNRLPVLLIPGDVFANRAPDPVLQQVESFGDGTVSANDAFRPVSRYFDRISRPEHLLTALPRAFATMTDPADCGPVTLAFCQDVQAEAYDWPAEFFAPKEWHRRRPRPGARELKVAADALRGAKRPIIIAGGGVLYAEADRRARSLRREAQRPRRRDPGRQVLPAPRPPAQPRLDRRHRLLRRQRRRRGGRRRPRRRHPAAGLHHRLLGALPGPRPPHRRDQRHALRRPQAQRPAAHRRREARPRGALRRSSATSASPTPARLKAEWTAAVDAVTAAPEGNALPTDMQVIGAVNRAVGEDAIVVCAAGGLPGELHKLWRAARPNGYHLEYGFSTMGYEIAGGLGVKMAHPDREVVVMLGDGSYMMMNSELATSVMLGQKLIVVLLDNRGFGCINRLQLATGGASFNNLLDTARHAVPSAIDFAAHAAAMGATAEKVDGIAGLEAAMKRARAANGSYVVVIDTDPMATTEAGGAWWDVAVPEVSTRETVRAARKDYEARRELQRLVD